MGNQTHVSIDLNVPKEKEKAVLELLNEELIGQRIDESEDKDFGKSIEDFSNITSWSMGIETSIENIVEKLKELGITGKIFEQDIDAPAAYKIELVKTKKGIEIKESSL
jgi:hypothetical protein